MNDTTLPLWIPKAHRVIYALCEASWQTTNLKKNGQPYRKPRPYAVPLLAQALVHCLGQQDETGAKAIFLQLNEIPQLGREMA